MINVIIFKYVRSSTNRVQPADFTIHNVRRQPIARRDLHLLRHMIAMFCIFIGGWAPIFFYVAIISDVDFTEIVYPILFMLAELSVLCTLIDLFLYNRQLRKHFTEKFIRRHELY